ncbi:hypothetical protein DXU02_28825 [Rhizobium leguminosarum]
MWRRLSARVARDVGQLTAWRYVPSTAPPRPRLEALLGQFIAGYLAHPFWRQEIIHRHIGRD